MNVAIWCNKSARGRESVFCSVEALGFSLKTNFSPYIRTLEFAHNVLHSFFQGKRNHHCVSKHVKEFVF